MKSANPVIAVRLLGASATQTRVEAAGKRASRVAELLLERVPDIRAAQVGGSFAKGTARADTASIDLFVALRRRDYLTRRGAPYKPSTVVRRLLKLLQGALEEYTAKGVVRLKRRTRSVHVMGPFRILSADDVAVRVVPVLWDGNREGVFLVPVYDANRWAVTSPVRQLVIVREYNADVPALLDGARLAHLWSEKQNLPLRPFALETLALVAAHQARLDDANETSPEGLFERVLRLLGSVRLERGLYVPGTWPPSDAFSARPTPVVILDPTVRDNNLTHYISGAEREKIRMAAREAQRQLRLLHRAVEERELARAETLASSVFG